LVEGKVVVNYKNIQKKLTPNDQLILNLETKTTTLQKVDVYNEISWKDGIFSFEEKSLFEIMKVLSRWYDVKVVFKNQKIQEEEFIGVLSKNQNIEDILKSIKNFGLVKNYTIKENQIILE
jgi:ferric-dicitrate binding protein FerR (iron transport regulator)